MQYLSLLQQQAHTHTHTRTHTHTHTQTHMATPNVSETLTFVKRYPIVLCGFSLFFMPSVHRLLLYFTPLLLSTAIFIVAMMSWGPSASSGRGKRRGKPKGGDEWPSFNEIDQEDDTEDEDMEETDKLQEEIPQKGKSSKDMQQDHISQRLSQDMQQKETPQKGKPSNDMHHEAKEKPSDAEPDPDLVLESEQEPADPDLAEERNPVGTASKEAVSSQIGGLAEPDPDLHRDSVGTVSNCASAVQHAQPGPDLHAEQNAEPDPDLHGESEDAHLQQLHGGCNEQVESDLQAAVAELRPQDMELAKAAAVRLEASRGISGGPSDSTFSHQPAPDHLQAMHAAA
eukprot:c21895_g1_i1 orf=185-1210(+)